MNEREEIHLQQLISALLDESISDEDMTKLDSLLLKYPQARSLYRSHLDIHFELREKEKPADVIDFLKKLPEPEVFPEQYNSLRNKLRFFQAIAAALILAFGLVFLMKGSGDRGINSKEAIAIITESKNLIWENQQTLKEGSNELYGGMAEIKSGEMTLQYENGAIVHLKGPAAFELISEKQAILHHGQIASRIPESARGFSIHSPGAAIVDLGTEFAMNVSRSGISNVHVYEGEVEVSLLGEDGYTLQSAKGFKDSSLLVNAPDSELKVLELDREGFIRIPQSKGADLFLPPDYDDRIRNAEPLAHWRFEEGMDGIVPNAMGADFSGQLRSGLSIQGNENNNYLFFSDENKGYFIVDDYFEGINEDSYTIELWVNPGLKRRMALASFVDVTPDQSKNNSEHRHLSYLEMEATPYDLKHKAYSFRFLHRYPTHSFGKNAFSRLSYIPGNWYHLVAVKTMNEMRLYINGDLERKISLKSKSGNAPYQLIIGQLDPIRSFRSFNGKIDELAVYNRALTADEIREHYVKQESDEKYAATGSKKALFESWMNN